MDQCGHQEMAQQLEKLLTEETRAGKDTGVAGFADAVCSFLQSEPGFPSCVYNFIIYIYIIYI